MLKVRVIPCLDVKDGRTVKGVNFVDLRDAGDPVALARAYDAQGADELCFLDITASHEKRGTMIDVVERTADACFMPLTVGGGVRTPDDMVAMLKAGADKVAINTAAVLDPEILTACARKVGSQAVVMALDVKREGDESRPAGASTPMAAATAPAGRRRIRQARRRTRRRRNPADLDGSRRRKGRLRHRPAARDPRRGARADHRLGRRRQCPAHGGRGHEGRRRRRAGGLDLPLRRSDQSRTPSARWRAAGAPVRMTDRREGDRMQHDPLGPAAYLGEVLNELAKTIDARAGADPAASWTAKLLRAGPPSPRRSWARKASRRRSPSPARATRKSPQEAADLLYHLLVALRSRGVTLDTVAKALEARQGKSGIEEKASRKG